MVMGIIHQWAQSLYVPYNLYSKGTLLRDITRKLAAAIAPTCALLHNTTSQIATEYLVSNPSQSLFFDDNSECPSYGMAYYLTPFQNTASLINSSPIIGAIKAIFIAKRVIDTYLTCNQWLKGETNSNSFFYHSSYLAIFSAPILMSQTTFGKTWEGQLMLNITMLSSLIFSANYDLLPDKWQLNGSVTSPTSTWLKNKFWSLSSYLISRT